MTMMNGVEFHEVRVSAPGKVILHGEHAVVYGKTALAVSLGLRTSIVIKETLSSDEPSINVHLPSVGLNEKLELKPIREKLFNPPSLLEKSQLSWTEPGQLDHEAHLKKIDHYLQKTRPNFESLKSNQQNSLRGFLYTFSGIIGSTSLPLCSMEVLLESQLSAGAGTGSSASFAVCLAGALIQLVKLKTGIDQTEFSTEDKKIISDWAYNCERIMHVSPSGIDNLTCTYGSLIWYRRGAEPRAVPLQLTLRILLVDTRVSRQTSALTQKVAGLRQWNTGAVDCIMEACDHIARTATEILESISTSTSETDIQVHYQRLEELWDMNHCLLGALGVSHAALEDVRRAARGCGLACKLTGAGGGGYRCAIVLIPPSSSQAQVERLGAQLAALGYSATDTQLAAPGVRLHS